MDDIAVIRLPDPALAPGFRGSLESRADMRVDEFSDGVVAISPREGPGATRTYFELSKICDASTDLDSDLTWDPLRRHSPRMREDTDVDAYAADLLTRAREFAERDDRPENQFVALMLQAFAAGQGGDMEAFLRLQLPALFEAFPDGALWVVGVDDVLLASLAFGRAQLAQQLMPDFPLGPDLPPLESMADLSLTQGVNFDAVISPALLLCSPGVLGFTLPCMPHVLVFTFGTCVDLRVPYPASLASLYRPSVLNHPAGLSRRDFLAGESKGDGEELLSWWVARLNAIYSHAADPTRFTNESGYHDAAAQTAWFVTVERLIADLVCLLAEPQATDLTRVQLAFDALDKAESVLGYGKQQSGRGFAALLRRKCCKPFLRNAFMSLPPSLRDRFTAEAERLIDDLYTDLRRTVAAHRLTPSGAKISSTAPDKLHGIDDDRLVSQLMRAIRNSSHGLLDVFRDGPDRYLLAATRSQVPPQLPVLVPFIVTAVLSDVAALTDGSAKRRLAGDS